MIFNIQLSNVVNLQFIVMSFFDNILNCCEEYIIILASNKDIRYSGGVNMEIKYYIDDNKLQNFTNEAKSKLIEQSREHTIDIIKEAENVEESLREYGATSEITGNIIFQAVRTLRRHPTKKFKWVTNILKIFSELLLFFAGCLFDQENFAKNTTQFYWFFAVFFIAAILTIALHFQEGE